MNEEKPEEVKQPAPDRLAIMLNMQSELQEKSFGTRVEDLTGVDRIQFFKEMKLALQDELHEALDEIGWKIWATSKHWNEEAVKGEMVDAWHFFMNLLIVSGMDAEELFERYMKKHQINVDRQEAGYDGVTGKCRGCHRAFDDEAVACHQSNVYPEKSCCHYNTTGTLV